MAGLVHQQNVEKRIEKQIGCMSGFLQIFDRQQILARKRIHSANRLRSSADLGASPETMSSDESTEAEKRVTVLEPASLDHFQSSPAENENGRPMVDGDDDQSRPPGVIARLMGLELLPSFDQKTKTVNTPPEPRVSRSASEPRVSRDLGHSKYIEGNNFQLKKPYQSQKHKLMEIASANLKLECSRTVNFEKKLKIRGIDEQLNDLTALKQILEVLQLKGLLHSQSNQHSHRNFVYDRDLHSVESSVHLQQWRSLASKVNLHRSVNNYGEAVNRSERIPVRSRSRTVSPNRIESNLKTCNSIIKRKSLGIVISHNNKTGSVHHSVTDRSSRNSNLTESSSINSPKHNFIKKVVTDDESTTDLERSSFEDCRDGRRLLERCSNLLNSIAEMNSATESPPSSATVIPSPVSVLDSGFDKDESSSHSHSIDFKATSTIDFEEDNINWSPNISPTEPEEFISNDSDFIYISNILQASQHLCDDSTVFFSIEKQFHNSDNTSTVSKRHRKLIFDVIREILDKNRQLPPWKSSIEDSRASIKQIWYQFEKIRETVITTGTGDGLLEFISGVFKKDFVDVKDWEDYPVQTLEVVLDTERLIFKDLVSEAILDLVEYSDECKLFRTRRKLVF